MQQEPRQHAMVNQCVDADEDVNDEVAVVETEKQRRGSRQC